MQAALKPKSLAPGTICLGRRAGQAIHIGRDIRVTVKKIDGRHVWLQITAPRAVRVDREEITIARARDIMAAARLAPEGEA